MMKRLLPLLIPALLAASPLLSQNRSIRFVEKPWADILRQAQEENKMIFLDAYTSWCGPCKWMAANMFTNDTIADFYNGRFLCAHFDMEKGEGIQLARTYGVSAYPTLLFLSPSGEPVHKRVGAPQKVRDYLDMATAALTPGDGLYACEKAFAGGRRDPAFMLKYLDRLQGAYQPLDNALEQFFKTVSDEALAEPAHWKILYNFISDMNSREFRYLVANQSRFSDRFGADSVKSKIYNTYLQSLTSYVRGRSFSESEYFRMKDEVRKSGFPEGERVIFTADLTLAQIKGDMAGFTSLAAAGTERHYGDDPVMLNRLAWSFLQMTSDPALLETAAGWARKAIAQQPLAENLHTLAHLLFKLGKKTEAADYARQAVEAAQKERVSTQMYEETVAEFSK